MKSLHKWVSKDQTPYIIGQTDKKIQLIGAEKSRNNWILQFAGDYLKNDKYRLFLKGRYLTIVLIEEKKLARPIYVHNLNWQQYDYSGYDLVKNIDVFLPGDNFYLIRHSFMTADQILNVYLTQEPFN